MKQYTFFMFFSHLFSLKFFQGFHQICDGHDSKPGYKKLIQILKKKNVNHEHLS